MSALLSIFSVVALIWAFSPSAQAGWRVELGGGYSYSRMEYRQHSASFSLLSNEGTYGLAEMGWGGKNYELFAEGFLSQHKYEAPPTRVIPRERTQLLDLGAGARAMWRNFSVAGKVVQKQSLLLNPAGGNEYLFEKSDVLLALGSLQFYAREENFCIFLQVEAGGNLSSGSSAGGEVSAERYYGASAKVNVGQRWRWSLMGGMRNYEYQSPGVTYSSFDFFAGVLLSLHFDSRGEGRKDNIPWNYTGPRYPLPSGR